MKNLVVIAVAVLLLAATAHAAPPSYANAASVTPNDAADLPNVALAIYVGGTGNLNVDMYNGVTVVFSGVPAGTTLPIKVKRVRAASTTATLIVEFY
jgi:hypothetical protein